MNATTATFSQRDVQQFIDREAKRRQSNKVLHGHPSPMYWKPLRTPVQSLLESRRNAMAAANVEVNLYVGTPFCIKTKPARCGFCLFPSEDYEGNQGVEAYLGYLEREFELYRPYYGDDNVTSIYFGGGTPNLYRPQHYAMLMRLVDKLYGGVPSDIEITLEGIPQLFNEEKIKAMHEAGFNRISMGVQQLNDKLIKYSGRRQTREQVLRAVELCHKYDMANSMDLIYGWPEQTPENMLEDLEDAVAAGVHHLTHYELNIAGRSDFASARKRALLPSIETNIDMYLASREYLRSAGFEQVTVYDWRRKPCDAASERLGAYDYEHHMHHFVEQREGVVQSMRQVCGIGYAAVNFHPNGLTPEVPSWIYMNHTSLQRYCADLDEGRFPVERGFMYEFQDIKLAWLFQSMQTMKIDYVQYMAIFHENLLDSYSVVWTELEKRGWLSIDSSVLHFRGKGQYHIPMLQSLIARQRLEQIRAQRKRSIQDIAVVIERDA